MAAHQTMVASESAGAAVAPTMMEGVELISEDDADNMMVMVEEGEMPRGTELNWYDQMDEE